MADYASAAEVFAALETHEADVERRLQALAAALPAAAAFAASAAEERRRRRGERDRLRRRLGLGPAAPSVPAEEPDGADLRGLREAQMALVHVHAEGLPALGDRRAVDVLAAHMVALAGQLTVLELWLEAEEGGG